MLDPIMPIGDYCGGLSGFLNAMFFGGVLVLVFIIHTIFNFIRFKKTKKFDFIPLILTLVFVVAYLVFFDKEPIKFWTKKTLTGFVVVENSPSSGQLILYENGSFATMVFIGDFSCTYQGDYEIEKNRLKLFKEDLVFLTSKVFTSEYQVDIGNNKLIPIDKSFTEIKITN